MNVAAVIEADLKSSGLFRPIEKAAFIDKITGTGGVPRFEDWRVINAQALVTGTVTQEADGRLQAPSSACGTSLPASRSSGSNSSPRRRTGVVSPISSPMRSMRR